MTPRAKRDLPSRAKTNDVLANNANRQTNRSKLSETQAVGAYVTRPNILKDPICLSDEHPDPAAWRAGPQYML